MDKTTGMKKAEQLAAENGHKLQNWISVGGENKVATCGCKAMVAVTAADEIIGTAITDCCVRSMKWRVVIYRWVNPDETILSKPFCILIGTEADAREFFKVCCKTIVGRVILVDHDRNEVETEEFHNEVQSEEVVAE